MTPDVLADIMVPDVMTADVLPDAVTPDLLVDVVTSDIVPDVLPDVVPADWWDPAWRVRIPLTIAAGDWLTSEVQKLPVLVRLSFASIPPEHLSADGADVRVLNAEQTELVPHEIDTWTGSVKVLWIRAPQVGPGRQEYRLWLYLGHSGPMVSPPLPPEEVWASSYQAVYHLGEENGPFHDSTGRLRPAEDHNTSQSQAAVGMGRSLDGIDDHIDLGLDVPILMGVTGWTLSAAIRLEGPERQRQDLISLSVHDELVLPQESRAALRLVRGNGDAHHRLVAVARADDAEDRQWSWTDSDLIVPAVVPRVVAATVDYPADTIRLYVDGHDQGGGLVSFGAGTSSTDPPTGNFLGADDDGVGYEFRGTIDEVRISDEVRSAAWMAAEHAGLRGGLVTLEAVQELP